MAEVAGSEFEIKADLVLLAMGFVHPMQSVLDAFGIDKDARNNAAAPTDGEKAYATNVDGVFVAGDVRRGQSLVVWAIREPPHPPPQHQKNLMGASNLAR